MTRSESKFTATKYFYIYSHVFSCSDFSELFLLQKIEYREAKMKRIGVIGIVVQSRTSDIAIEVQKLLSEYSDIIIGRMGVPVPENGISAISVIVRGENERISALNGKLGRLDNVNVKSALSSVEIQ